MKSKFEDAAENTDNINLIEEHLSLIANAFQRIARVMEDTEKRKTDWYASRKPKPAEEPLGYKAIDAILSGATYPQSIGVINGEVSI